MLQSDLLSIYWSVLPNRSTLYWWGNTPASDKKKSASCSLTSAALREGLLLPTEHRGPSTMFWSPATCCLHSPGWTSPVSDVASTKVAGIYLARSVDARKLWRATHAFTSFTAFSGLQSIGRLKIRKRAANIPKAFSTTRLALACR